MKTILVPTDYSEVANNAGRYAIELAKRLDASLLLFHAFRQLPLLSSLPLIFNQVEQNKIALEELKAEEYTMKHECCSQVTTESVVFKGSVTNGILEIIKTRKIDYIVMGINDSSLLSEILVGSHAISVVNKTNIPIFIIPKNSKFKKIKKFVFVHNYYEPIPKNVSEELKTLCTKLKTELMIYGKPELHGEGNLAQAVSLIEKEFAKAGPMALKEFISYIDEEDLSGEIISYIEETHADLLAMLPSQSKTLSKLFQRDDAILMAYISNVPLLILHEEN